MDKRDQQFSELMKSYQGPTVPVDFTKNVMDKVYAENEKSNVFKPIFGKWFLPGVIIAIAVFLSFALFESPSTTQKQTELIGSVLEKIPQTDLSGISNIGQHIVDWLTQVPMVVLFTFLVATILLAIDWLLINRHQKSVAL